MAKRLLEYQPSARIASTPDHVVAGGDMAQALTALGGNVAGRLKQMADRARSKEGDMAGLNAGQVSGAGYLERQASVTVAAEAGSAVQATERLAGGVDQHIVSAATKYGVSPDTLRMIAGIESNGNPNAKNPNSSAGGLFQFVDGTAKDYGLVNRFDPGQASDAAARLLRNNSQHLARVLGRTPTPAELYLAHQQGAGGAAKLLSNPNARAADVVGMKSVTGNGGNADMTAGEFAGLWLGKAGGSVPKFVAPEAPATGGLNPQPLALRNDNTIYGDAFDGAAIRSYGWRMQEGVSNAVSGAYDQFKDDPSGFAQALGGIREQFSQDENFGDPGLRDLFDKTFAERTRTYTTAVTQRHETRVMEEQSASFGAGVDAMRGDLEKQAYLLGANPEADQILGSQSAVVLRNIDAAEASNVITPTQAQAQREQLNQSLAYARTNGVFASLPTPAAKQAFANDLLTDWANDEGPLTDLGYTQVKALTDQLSAQALQAQNTLTGENKIELARVQGLMEADIASIASTGVAIDTAANKLEPDRLAALGIDTTAWQAARDHARQGWEATAGMELETPVELNDRLVALQPVPGSPNFVQQSEIYGQAVARRDAVLKERETDPMGQAARAGLVALEPIDPGSSDSMVLRKQQAEAVASSYGTPVSYFRPEERTAMTAALYQKPELMPDFALNVVAAFGDKAPAALAEVSDAAPELAYAAGITASLGDNGIISEVSRVVAGRRDKTINVKLPGEAAMTAASGQVIGGALAGNPATRSAALNVAQILFEGQAAALGFDPADIKEPGSAAFTAWERSVNRALGARTIKGVQYGGLARVNGGQTVAPSSMPADRLQQLVSTLAPEDLAALPPIGSGNGVPVSAWQIQGAQLVAVGDGQYRVALGDPAGLEQQFLTTPEGEYWVLDAAALDAARAKRPSTTSMWDAVFNPAKTALGMGGQQATPIVEGNIDLNARQVVNNADGSISTEQSMSFGEDGYEVLIPTVFAGKHHTDEEAIAHYEQSGEHLGKFRTPEEATAFAIRLHDQQAERYGAKK